MTSNTSTRAELAHFCGQCGSRIHGTPFCMNCGARMITPATEANEEQGTLADGGSTSQGNGTDAALEVQHTYCPNCGAQTEAGSSYCEGCRPSPIQTSLEQRKARPQPGSGTHSASPRYWFSVQSFLSPE